MADDGSVRIRTKHGELTLQQIAEMQPGMARLMDEYGRRFWALYYAAKAGNWELARYMHKQLLGLGNIAAVARAKYAESMREFERDHMGPLGEAIKRKEWGAFEAEYRRAVAASDTYHAKFNYGFIHFQLPDHPPEWLRMDGKAED
jgi:hypothetical protein